MNRAISTVPVEINKTTLSFQNSLEKLRKAVILTVMVYNREWLHIKLSKRKHTHRVELLQLCFPYGQSLILPAIIDDNV